ncbi:MAG: tRNA (cytosine(32)/uridine(32)-2'-O)-methyltransferase TrmJ [Gammaproteobacteria bacterium]
MLDQIRIVMVNTSHPGNIGSAARAMKTMGLSQLYLVDPEKYPDPKAEEMASNAVDVLQGAIRVSSVEEAIADCTLVIGTSARSRKIPWPLITPREVADKAKREPAPNKIAILFGREDSGLTNEELQLCHFHVQIPANPDYSSLNIASAIQVIAYELRVASLDITTYEQDWDYRVATADEMEKFFAHLEEVLIEIDFLKLSAPRQLMARLRRLYLRARPDTMEMNILRGMLTAVQAQNKNK